MTRKKLTLEELEEKWSLGGQTTLKRHGIRKLKKWGSLGGRPKKDENKKSNKEMPIL